MRYSNADGKSGCLLVSLAARMTRSIVVLQGFRVTTGADSWRGICFYCEPWLYCGRKPPLKQGEYAQVLILSEDLPEHMPVRITFV